MDISVIVPVYNVERYLDKCIKSLVKSENLKIEIILVNDGSTDESLKICKKYADKDSRIKIINKKNGGLSSARNAGLDIAKGKYILFVDSDDYVREDIYDVLYGVCANKDIDIAICKHIKVYDDQEVKLSKGKDGLIEYIDNIEALKNLYGKVSVCSWGKLYNSKLFEGIRFPEGKIHEDEFITPLLLYKANKICLVDECLYYYRQVGSSIMNRKFNVNRLDIIEAFDKRIELSEKINDRFFYNKTLVEFKVLLIDLYCKVDSHLKDESILKEIDNKYKDIKLDIWFSKAIKFKTKVKLNLFNISPKVYIKITKLLRRI